MRIGDIMWGNDYRWELRINAQAARDRLVVATRPAKPRLCLPTSPFDEDWGVVNGVIGNRNFSLRFIPYRNPWRVGTEGEDMGEDAPDDTVRVVDGRVPPLGFLVNPGVTFVGEIHDAEFGCIVKGGLWPGGLTLFWLFVFFMLVLVPVLNASGWPTAWIALTAVPVMTAGYWLAGVLSDGDKRVRGVLRFLDDTLAYAAVKRPGR